MHVYVCGANVLWESSCARERPQAVLRVLSLELPCLQPNMHRVLTGAYNYLQIEFVKALYLHHNPYKSS